MIETLASLQTKLNETNNKLAEAQISNIRLKEFNSQMYELVKGGKLTDKLEKELEEDIEEQNTKYEKKDEKKDSKAKAEAKTTSSPNNTKNNKIDKKCWYYESGFCRKGLACNWLHPVEICKSFSKYAQCPRGQGCPLRHPLTICMRYMEGGCHNGDVCVMQHPINTSPSRAPPPQAPSSSSSPPRSFYQVPTSEYRPYVQNNLPPHPSQYYQYGYPGTHPGHQTPPQAPRGQGVGAQSAQPQAPGPMGPSSAPPFARNGQPQGFW